MHLPFIAKVFADAKQPIKLLPMMVGQVGAADLPKYAEMLKGYFLDPRTLFVISSDFCHWGSDFDYQPVLQEFEKQGATAIHKSIAALDQHGMTLIEKHDLRGFQEYLAQTGNTICGERPIQVLLAMILTVATEAPCETKFVKYGQSGKV